jgi:transcriptional regulator with XRE-family HTH domain
MDNEIQFRTLFGELLSTARFEKGLTQKELGIAIGYKGNSAGQMIHKIEEGKISAPKKKVADLLEILGITHKQLGVDENISLPLWITSQGKKGRGLSLKDCISTAETFVTEISEITETVATSVADISEIIISGIVSGASSQTKSESSTLIEKEKKRISQIALKLTQKMLLKEKATEELTIEEKIEIIATLCDGNVAKVGKIIKILG